MYDFDYPVNPETTFNGYADRCCRSAVLWPLASPGLRAAVKVAGKRATALADAYAALRKAWRRRASRLGEAGWDAVKDSPGYDPSNEAGGKLHAGYRLTVMCNCPPFGVRLPRRRGRRCTRARACPFCFARQVTRTLYFAVHWAFCQGGEKAILPGGTRLFACRRHFDKRYDAQAPGAWVAGASKARFGESRRVTRGVRGTAVVTTVEPGDDRGRVVVRRATVLALSPTADVSAITELADVECRELAADAVTPAAIATLAAWAARYPRGMMYGDPGVAADLMNAAAATRARMLTTAGIFRNKQAQGWSPPGADDAPDSDG